MIRKSIYFLTLAVVMCFASCEKYDHAIADIEDRLDKIEGTSINTIEQQITNINTSLTDLKNMDAALQTLIDDLETEATNLKTELEANAEADAATKRGLEDKITALETLIATLQTKDKELDKKIADLETYVNDEITATEDWANATFSTLEQYEEVQMWIEAFKVAIDNLNKWTSETDILLALKFADIEKVIADTETTMKAWVNEQLEQPLKDIAALQAALSALTNDVATDEELANAVATQEKALEEAVDDLVAAYEKAIKKAIEDNNGVIDEAISNAITTATNKLQDEINSIKSEITSIKRRLDALESNFANRIQSLTYIPTHTDGKATMTYNSTSGIWEAELSFFVTPKSVVGNIKREHFSAKGVYTAVIRAVNLIDLSVTAFESDATNGTITVTVSGNNLTNFLSGTSDAAVFLIISDGNNEFVSDYVPLTMGQTYTYDQASNTYTVYAAEGLNEIAQKVNAGEINADIELASNVDLSAYTNWQPIGTIEHPFTGSFDGNGYSITGLTINDTEDANNRQKAWGLFGVVDGSTDPIVIQHVTVHGSITVNGTGNTSSRSDIDGIGGIAGRAIGNVTFIGCHNNATITVSSVSTYTSLGGIVAYSPSGQTTFVGCGNTGGFTLTGSGGSAGGICNHLEGGSNKGDATALYGCYNRADIVTPDISNYILGFVDYRTLRFAGGYYETINVNDLKKNISSPSGDFQYVGVAGSTVTWEAAATAMNKAMADTGYTGFAWVCTNDAAIPLVIKLEAGN